jgi:D-psicose/D-tagatose/L-ribulose 3-epimerase
MAPRRSSSMTPGQEDAEAGLVMRRRAFLTSLALCAVAGAPRLGAAQTARTGVQVGYCTGWANVAAAKAAGFDYVELGTSEIATMDDAAFERAAAELARIGLPTPASNGFLPASLKVTGPAIDSEAQMTYVRRAFDRMRRLGTSLIVFGSGGARRVPEGFDHGEAFLQLVEFGKRIAPEAAMRGITVCVEPLRRQECNIINSAAEGLKLVAAIAHPNFQQMIDFYHLASEKEDPAIVLAAGARLRHLHVANPQGRVFPQEWTEFDYAPFFANLRRIGYRGRISVEASTKALAADAPRAIALLRRAFEP